MPSLFSNLQPGSSYIIVDRRGQRFVGIFVRIVNANGAPAAEFRQVLQASNKQMIPGARFLESQVSRISFAPDNLF